LSLSLEEERLFVGRSSGSSSGGGGSFRRSFEKIDCMCLAMMICYDEVGSGVYHMPTDVCGVVVMVWLWLWLWLWFVVVCCLVVGKKRRFWCAYMPEEYRRVSSIEKSR
jgi:hypothetical protein